MTSFVHRPSRRIQRILCITLLALAGHSVAADWCDLAVSWRHGNRFAEPFGRQDIHKDILGLTYVSGYRYGTQLLDVDLLLSDDRDPRRFGSSDGAREAYVVYRHTLDLSKISDRDFRLGPVRSLGLTAGFDWNSKQDAGYNSRKRMLVLGPTVMFDVPGYLNASLLLLRESNHPSVSPGAFDPGYPASRYSFRTHPMLNLAWGIPLGEKTAFEGYANLIGAKGKDEVGTATARELNADLRLLYDLSASINAAPRTFRAGFQYQYWRNKFGNDHTGPAGNGAFARTPMLRAEYRF